MARKSSYEELEQRVKELEKETTLLRQTKEALNESENKYRSLYTTMLEGVCLHELIYSESGKPVDNRIIDVNPAYEKILGVDKDYAVGRKTSEIFLPCRSPYLSIYEKIATTGQPQFFETYFESKDKYLSVSVFSPSNGQFATVFSDITDRKKSEEERLKIEEKLHQAQKLESLGLLAGGIAHDFNNILMGILGNADMALMDISPASPVIRNLKNIKKASQQAADLAGQMLAYSGKGKFEIEAININEAIKDMSHLLDASLSKKVLLKYNFIAPIPSIEADITQIRQIVMNLIINAAEAIGEDSGVIKLSTGVMACDRSYFDNTWLSEEHSEGNYVYIDVTDTGHGIKESDIPNIFDPFFTTKFIGRGLGLSAVQGIVRGHKGAIKIISEPLKGTTFKVLFPACDQPANFMARELSLEEAFSGSGTILLVDDEEAVRDIGTRMLERMGFSVFTANDGYMAVDLYKAKSKEIFCVLLDLTMPRMDGEEAFRKLCSIREDVHVILSSGYNEQEIVNRFGDRKPSGFIQKPYEYKKLISEMKKIVEERDIIG